MRTVTLRAETVEKVIERLIANIELMGALGSEAREEIAATAVLATKLTQAKRGAVYVEDEDDDECDICHHCGTCVAHEGHLATCYVYIRQ